ncbi:MAG TPA: biotin/lipoyl-containing protein [Candidatus Limnocylindrales bacterium]
MAAVSRAVRVAPIDPSGKALDEGARDLDPKDPTAPSVADLGGGRFVVAGGAAGEDRHTGRIARLVAEAGAADRYEVVVDGWRFELEVEDAVRASLRRRATRAVDAEASSGPLDIRAIIPGRVAAVRVTAGEVVEPGRTLLVVEAMKMQNELRAPRAGTVQRVAVGEGQTIERGDLLVVLT